MKQQKKKLTEELKALEESDGQAEVIRTYQYMSLNEEVMNSIQNQRYQCLLFFLLYLFFDMLVCC